MEYLSNVWNNSHNYVRLKENECTCKGANFLQKEQIPLFFIIVVVVLWVLDIESLKTIINNKP